MAHVGDPLPKETSRWHPLFHLAPGLYMMSRRMGSRIQTALLYIHSFRPLLAHTFQETERMVLTDPDTLTTTADKLRYYRHVRGLEQQEVAAYVTLHRGTYAGYETSGVRDYYPLDKLSALAELFEVPLDYLLDDYNRFLYEGQRIKQVRALKGMTQKEYAKYLGVPFGTLQQWEQDRVSIFKSTWEN